MRLIVLSTIVTIALALSPFSTAVSQTFFPTANPTPNPQVVYPSSKCCGASSAPTYSVPQQSHGTYTQQNIYATQPPVYYGTPVPAQHTVHPNNLIHSDGIPAAPQLANPIHQPAKAPIAPATIQPTEVTRSVVKQDDPAPKPVAETKTAPEPIEELETEAVEEVATITEVVEEETSLQTTEPETEIEEIETVVEDTDVFDLEEVQESTETVEVTAPVREIERAVVDVDAPEPTDEDIFSASMTTEESVPHTIESEVAVIEEEPVAQETTRSVPVAKETPKRVREIPTRKQTNEQQTAQSRRVIPAATQQLATKARKSAAAPIAKATKSPAIAAKVSRPATASGFKWWMAAPLALLPIGWFFFKRKKASRTAAVGAADTYTSRDQGSEPRSAKYFAETAATETTTTKTSQTARVAATPVATPQAYETTREVKQNVATPIATQPATAAPKEAVIATPTENVRNSTIVSADTVKPATTAKPAAAATNSISHNVATPAVTGTAAAAAAAGTAAAAATAKSVTAKKSTVIPPTVAATKTAGANRDDLTILEGVTPETQQALYAAGFNRFSDFEKADPTTIQQIFTRTNGSSDFQIESWLKQASFAARGDWSGLAQQIQSQPAAKFEQQAGVNDTAKFAASTSKTNDSSATKRDDLTKLEGVSPKTQQAFYDAGFHRFSDFEKADPTNIQRIFAGSTPNGSDFNIESWLKQASFAARGDWSGLAEQIRSQPAAKFEQQTGTNDTAKFGATGTTEDLTRINGIGPATVALLNSFGIRSFKQVAGMDSSQLRAILTKGGSNFQHIDPTTWPTQATYASQGNWRRLAEFTDSQQKRESKSVTSAAESKTRKNEGEATELTQIRGIAPATAGVLNEIGIRSIADLATADRTAIETELARHGTRFQNADPSDWLSQAKSISEPQTVGG